MTLFIARYLWGVSSHFASSGVLTAGLTVFGMWTIQTMPGDVGAAYVPILFGQLFAASSGFRQAADAGHLDGLLVGGACRTSIAIVHFALSAGPGAMAWLVVYATELGTLGIDGAAGLRPQYLVALGLVSSMSWAVTLPSVRLTGGVLWAVAMGLVAVSPQGLGWFGEVLSETPAGAVETMAAVAAMMLCPFLLLVPHVDHVSGDLRVLTALGIVAGVGVTAGVAWIVARDYSGIV